MEEPGAKLSVRRVSLEIAQDRLFRRSGNGEVVKRRAGAGDAATMNNDQRFLEVSGATAAQHLHDGGDRSLPGGEILIYESSMGFERGGGESGGGSADGARSGETGSPRCSADARRGRYYSNFSLLLVRVFAGWLWWVGGSEVRAALRRGGVGSGGEGAGGARGGRAGGRLGR